MQASNSSLHRHAIPPGLAVLITTVVAGIALALSLAVAPHAGAKKASLGGTLSGSTSQGNPGWVRVSSNGRMIREASLTITVRCPVGLLLLPQKVRSLSITPNGRFKGTLEDTSEEEGIVLRIFESLSGRFNPERTSVDVKSRLRLTFEEPDGTVEACDSGPVTLHATR